MQLADTQAIRNIVNNIVGDSAKYTDKGVNNQKKELGGLKNLSRYLKYKR